jgi:hypothetical protein
MSTSVNSIVAPTRKGNRQQPGHQQAAEQVFDWLYLTTDLAFTRARGGTHTPDRLTAACH